MAYVEMVQEAGEAGGPEPTLEDLAVYTEIVDESPEGLLNLMAMINERGNETLLIDCLSRSDWQRRADSWKEFTGAALVEDTLPGTT